MRKKNASCSVSLKMLLFLIDRSFYVTANESTSLSLITSVAATLSYIGVNPPGLSSYVEQGCESSRTGLTG